jgi:hypothetical protein
MKARTIQIGDSPGVAVPREEWEAAFRQVAERGDDVLGDEEATLTSFDDTEWKW